MPHPLCNAQDQRRGPLTLLLWQALPQLPLLGLELCTVAAAAGVI